MQPDTLVPEPKNPQALNRYAYTYNNPLKFVDPNGHEPELEETFEQDMVLGSATPTVVVTGTSPDSLSATVSASNASTVTPAAAVSPVASAPGAQTTPSQPTTPGVVFGLGVGGSGIACVGLVGGSVTVGVDVLASIGPGGVDFGVVAGVVLKGSAAAVWSPSAAAIVVGPPTPVSPGAGGGVMKMDTYSSVWP